MTDFLDIVVAAVADSEWTSVDAAEVSRLLVPGVLLVAGKNGSNVATGAAIN